MMSEVKVFDADGNEKDLLWAQVKYNLPPIEEALGDIDHWEVVELRESIGPSSMTVRVIGDEIAGVEIAFGWPDGIDFQNTNAEGHTGFGMGGGAYYNPSAGEHGPHLVHVLDVVATDCVQGLGMIGGTNHAHLEPTFRLVKGEEQPSPSRTFRIEGIITITEEE